MAVPGIAALAFDTGGTVLDWHSGIRGVLAEAGARHGVERTGPPSPTSIDAARSSA